MREDWSGGCQCGAVRFRATGPFDDISICNCRMCQKATGSLLGAFVSVPNTSVAWTRGAPTYFVSSSAARRGFCPNCGTPLTYVWRDDWVALAVGAFDRAADLMPTIEHAPESRHALFAHMDELEGRPLADSPEAEAALARRTIHQHPDHDTETWPPAP